MTYRELLNQLLELELSKDLDRMVYITERIGEDVRHSPVTELNIETMELEVDSIFESAKFIGGLEQGRASL